MRNFIRSFPVPIGIAPILASFIATRSHELEIQPVGDHELINCECRDVYCVTLVLVVPAKLLALTRNAKGCFARRDLNHPMQDRRTRRNRCTGLSDFLLEWQLMQHVSERFEMH